MTIFDMISEISVDTEDMEYYKDRRESLYKLKDVLNSIYEEFSYGINVKCNKVSISDISSFLTKKEIEEISIQQNKEK